MKKLQFGLFTSHLPTNFSTSERCDVGLKVSPFLVIFRRSGQRDWAELNGILFDVH